MQSRMLRRLVSAILLRLLRVRIVYRDASIHALSNGPCVVACNHVSYLDGLLIALASPVPLTFASEPAASVHHPVLSRGMALLSKMGYGSVVPLDGDAPFGLRELARALRRRQSVMLFPEGVISGDGSASLDRPGLQWLCRRGPAAVVRVHIQGAERSRVFGKVGTHWWPQIVVTF